MPRKEKKYHYIYKTTCSLTKRFYFGMHSTDNLDDGYLGSGSELSKSLKKYGKSNHFKEILEYLNNRKELKKRETEIITEDLRKNSMCMNLAKGGGGSDYTLGLIPVKDKNGNTFSCHKNDPRYLRGEVVHHSKGNVTVKDKNGKTLRVSKNDPRYLSGELVSNFKGNVLTKDKNGKKIYVSVNDPRYLRGELVNIHKGTIKVKDKNGKTFIVQTNNSRYLNGELNPIWTGKKHSKETIEKMKLSHKGLQDGEKNSQYGKCWITNEKENKKINKDDLIPKGWRLGRKMKIK